MELEEFNRLDARSAGDVVRPCLDVDRWVDAVVAGRPYPDRAAALESARTAAWPWTDAEIDAALSRHPRIGDRPGGMSAEASLSRAEQAGVAAASADLAAALAEANRQYEAKFSRVFLIRASGRTAEEVLEALRERLAHSEAEELPVIAEQLRQIAVLRLEGILSA
ncbi:2-oxo-4-hydroxy-4-carboxy-5-ureidoimidazoline decarboxylase [Microbacterium atlanticum]|uniref:2-oxo-4-hydroxy-4-carboxy-5-ureidoimidazoline decarboxylase n=1 Tax=Microbacterium atlanticum TaxID=2782168 RepID=UPI0018885E12|nr:2-oxo-4-hydroxy-4-carboxy-5-ureidoimidazoline decarboxylase [Microbacterium atlanticum]